MALTRTLARAADQTAGTSLPGRTLTAARDSQARAGSAGTGGSAQSGRRRIGGKRAEVIKNKKLLTAAGAVLAGLAITGVTACGTTAATAATVHVTQTVTVKPVPAVTQTVTVKPVPAVTQTVTVKPVPTVTKTLATAPAVPVSVPVYVPPPVTPQYTNALSVVDQFYQDITDQDYSAAWNLGGDNLNGGADYNGWVAGYDTTVSITLYDTANFGSGEVTADLSALQRDGSTNTYYGTYYVTNGVITSANIAQTS
jgi:hypothetical protein